MKNGWVLLLVSLLGYLNANGQIISGRVVDENQQPLPYVNIGIEGRDRGTISTMDGTFEVDISGIDNSGILRFSSVGFENADYPIGDLKFKEENRLNVILKSKVYALDEVLLIPDDANVYSLGSNKRGRRAWVFSEAVNGAEIGMLIKNMDSIYLRNFSFHIKNTHCDSIRYRVNLYNVQNEMPDSLINKKNIFFTSRKRRGWEKMDLTDYGITVNEDFIITLETIKGSCRGKDKRINLSLGPRDGLSFFKDSSMAPWNPFAGGMSFKIEVSKY